MKNVLMILAMILVHVLAATSTAHAEEICREGTLGRAVAAGHYVSVYADPVRDLQNLAVVLEMSMVETVHVCLTPPNVDCLTSTISVRRTEIIVAEQTLLDDRQVDL